MKLPEKIRLNTINKYLGALIIFFAPIDRYLLDVPFVINLSIYRILIIFLIGSFIIQKILDPKVYGKNSFYLVLSFYFIGLFIGIVQSNRIAEFSSYFLNELMGLILIVIFVNIYERRHLGKLINVFISSFIFPIVISIYVYFVFYTQLQLIDILPLSDKLPFFRTIEFDTTPFRAGLFPRLGLPYSTSPLLAIVASIMLFLVGLYYKSSKKYFLIFPILFIMLGTLSRTVIVSVILTLCLYYLVTIINKYYNLFVIKKSTLVGYLITLFLIALIINTAAYNVLMGRISAGINIGGGRHFILLIEGFYIITESFKNLLLGVGDGNLYFREGYLTYLPSHGLLNSYFTIFVHRGLIGFLCVISLYLYIFYNLFLKSDKLNRVSYALLFSFLNVLIAFNFYELRFVNAVWILMALAAIFINKDQYYKVEKNTNNVSS